MDYTNKVLSKKATKSSENVLKTKAIKKESFKTENYGEFEIPHSLGQKIWNNYIRLSSNQINSFKTKATEKIGIENVNHWMIENKDYYKIYEYIYSTAKKYLFKPEFIHSILMGEGLIIFINDNIIFDENAKIDSYRYLGLDNIGNNYNSLETLIPNITKMFSPYQHTIKNELNEDVLPGIIIGYKNAIEILTAELANRRQIYLSKAENIGLPTQLLNDQTIEFITYAAFNNLNVADEIVSSLAKFQQYTKKYTGKPRDDQKNVRYNTLVRLSVSFWLKESKIYNV